MLVFVNFIHVFLGYVSSDINNYCLVRDDWFVDLAGSMIM